LIFPERSAMNDAPVKSLLPTLILSLALLAPAMAEPKEKKPYTLYAQFTEDTEVQLSTGARWMMDKGDCFPVYMFRDQQTKLILRLASATFTTEATHIRILKDSESGAALLSYRKNVNAFLKTQSEEWQKGAAKNKGPKPESQ